MSELTTVAIPYSEQTVEYTPNTPYYDERLREPLSQFVTTHTPELTINHDRYEQIRQKVREIHDIENEARIIKSMHHLPEEKRRTYIHDQLTNMVGEHFSELPFNTLHFTIHPDGAFDMYGLDLLQMYANTARMQPPGAREWVELEGMQKVHQALSAGYSFAAEVSPAYEAERKFVFAFGREGNEGVEYVLRRSDKPGQLQDSIQIQQSLQALAGIPVTPASAIQSRDDLVANPVVFSDYNPRDVAPLLRIVGITEDDIEYSHKAKYILEIAGSDLIETYYGIVTELSMMVDKKDTEDYKNSYSVLLEKAQLILERLCIIGDDISHTLKHSHSVDLHHIIGTIQSSLPQLQITSSNYFEELARYNRANSKKLEIHGGSDCGVTKKSFTNSVMEMIERKIPLPGVMINGERITADPNRFDDYECPKCKKSIPGERTDGKNWKTNCPWCEAPISCKPEENSN